jgi:amino acid permease
MSVLKGTRVCGDYWHARTIQVGGNIAIMMGGSNGNSISSSARAGFVLACMSAATLAWSPTTPISPLMNTVSMRSTRQRTVSFTPRTLTYLNRGVPLAHNRDWTTITPTSTAVTPTTIGIPSSVSLRASIAASDDGAAAAKESDKGTGTATIPNEVFNLVKSIVGAGVLTLPSGIAAFGNAPSAVVPAIGLIALFGILSGYGFGLIGRVCALTGTTSYRSAWESSVDASTSWIPALSCTLKTIFATLAYSMILGDTFTSLAVGAGLTGVSKTVVLGSVTSIVLLPLCLLKNLNSLAPFSLLGSLGMVYTAAAMAIRYFGRAYTVTTGKAALSSLAKDLPAALRPAFGTNGAASAFSPVTAILLGMLSTAYMAHFNAPKFYTELKNNTVPRYLTVVATAFGCSIGLFGLIATLGFLTFGGNCSGLILNNYSTRDTLMGISRIAVAVSLVFSYPLAFVGARDGILDLFTIKNRSASFLNTLTVGLLSSITVAALVIPDVSFVLAFAG